MPAGDYPARRHSALLANGLPRLVQHPESLYTLLPAFIPTGL